MKKLNVHREQVLALLIFILIAYICFYFSSQAVILDTDSGRIWHFSKLFLESGPSAAFRTLEVPLPVVLYATFMGMFGYNFPLAIIQGIFSVLIILTVYKFVQRSNYQIAALPLLLFLFSSEFFVRSASIKPYPLFVFGITLSLYFFHETTKSADKKKLIFSALFMALALYSFNFTLIAFPIPLMFVVLNKLKGEGGNLKNILIFYFFLLLFSAPWFAWRIPIAGKYFYQSPYTWIWAKYRRIISREFFRRPYPRSLAYYSKFIRHFDKIIFFSFAAAFGLLGFFKLDRRAKNLVSSWILLLLSPIILGILPPETRYFYPLLPVVMVLVTFGILATLELLYRPQKILLLSFIVVLTLAIVPLHINNFVSVQSKLAISLNDYQRFKQFIKPNENIFSRSYSTQVQFPHNNILTKSDFSEKEARKSVV